MIVQESSLEIGQDSMFDDDNYVYEEIEENGEQSTTKYSSFRSKPRVIAWSLSDTNLFYQVIYNLISLLIQKISRNNRL